MEITTIAEISISYKPSLLEEGVKIKTSWEAAAVLRRYFPEDTIHLQERVVVMFLNKCNNILGVYPMSAGGVTGTVLDVRLLFAIALKAVAVNIILCHNHPSGNMEASEADKEVTERVKRIGNLMDIKLLDHLILHPEEGRFLSLADEGLV